MSGRKYDFGDVEELTAVLEQRSRLEGVSKFLEMDGADEEMLCAIDEAIEGLENFLNEELLSKIHVEPASIA